MSKPHFPLPRTRRKREPTHAKNMQKNDPQTLQNRAQKPFKNRIESRSPKQRPKIRKSAEKGLQNELQNGAKIACF